MAKKKTPSKARLIRKKVPVKTDIASVEGETMKRVNSAIANIEDFLAKWEASKTKPDDIFPQIVKVKRFHDALNAWRKDAVKRMGKESDEARLRRLRNFVLICQTYS